MTASALVHGGTFVDARGRVDDAWVLLDGGVAVATGSGDSLPDAPAGAERIDAAGGFITPGFLDLHGHGGGGASYEGGVESIAQARAAHRAHGATRSLLSVVSGPLDHVEATLDAVRTAMVDDQGILGVHLEGPYLATGRKGAHAEQHLRVPDPATVDRLIEAGAGVVRQITIAPELPGAMQAIQRFVAAGFVVAIGHTEADYDTAKAAFDRGATLVTHVFNAMNPLTHRAPGPALAAFQDPRVTVELVADGIHVDARVIRMVFDLAPGRVALVTDAMDAAASADGTYRLGDLDVEVADGRAVLAGTDTIAGSTLTVDAALRCALAAGVDVVDAVAALTTTPARVLGLQQDSGAGGFVVWNDDWTVRRVLS